MIRRNLIVFALPSRLIAEWDAAANNNNSSRSGARILMSAATTLSADIPVPMATPLASSSSATVSPPSGWLFEPEAEGGEVHSPPVTTQQQQQPRKMVAASSSSPTSGLPLPEDVNPMSPLHAKWTCADCGKKWSARISDRCNPQTDLGCPACALKRVQGSSANAPPGGGGGPSVPGSDDKKSSDGCADATPEEEKSSTHQEQQGKSEANITQQLIVDAYPQIAGEWAEVKNQSITRHELHMVASDAMFQAWWLCFRCREHWRSSVVDRCHGPLLSDGRRGPKAQCPKCTELTVGTSHAPNARKSSSSSSPSVRYARGTLGAARPDLVAQVIGFGAPSLRAQIMNSADSEAKSKGNADAESTVPGLKRQRSEIRLRIIREEVGNLPLDAAERLVWQCPQCSISYKDSVKRRAQGFNCPSCSDSGHNGESLTPNGELHPGNTHKSVAALRPDVMAELAIGPSDRHSLKLASVIPLTSTRVFSFRCSKCGQLYKMSMRERCFNFVDKFGCPQCRFVTTVSGSGAGVVNQPRYNMGIRRTTKELALMARAQGRSR